MGQQKLHVKTNEGRDSHALYQIAEVSRPLTAVSATCDARNYVVYAAKGRFIHNVGTGVRTHFERKWIASGLYILLELCGNGRGHKRAIRWLSNGKVKL